MEKLTMSTSGAVPLANNSDSLWKTLVAPLKSYYPQLCWGRFCDVVQPFLDHHFSGNEIVPRLWLANHASVCDRQALEDRNIELVVTAAIGIRPQFPKDFRYLCLPLRDTSDQLILPYLWRVTGIMHEKLSAGDDENGPGVIVHCRCGVSRSVTIVAAYLIRYHGMTTSDAIHFIQGKRACANPISSFRNQLGVFEGECRLHRGVGAKQE